MDVFIVNMVVLDIILLFLVIFIFNNVKLLWSSGSGICKMCYYLVFVLYVISVLILFLVSVDCFYGICLLMKYR